MKLKVKVFQPDDNTKEMIIDVVAPAYLKSFATYGYVTEEGKLIQVSARLVAWWDLNKDCATYTVTDLLRDGQPCSAEEFETAYRATLETIQAAVDAVVVNS